MSISINQNFYHNNVKAKNNQSLPFKAKNSYYSQLSKELFNKDLPASNNISFGWSNYLSEVEKDILDVLTNPQYKSAIVVSHSSPDGDAYGSNIGIAGILESLGKEVNSVIDFRPKKTFQNLQSPKPDVPITSYIKHSSTLETIKPSEILVFTDTSEPMLLNQSKSTKRNHLLDLLENKSPKKVIIIDHHPDQEGEPTNYEKWALALQEINIPKDKILYWREKRASAAEMVSELDQEMVKESSIRKIDHYNKNFNHAYRLAVATGIITDANGTTTQIGEIDKTKFGRLSYQTNPESGLSKTRHEFQWLINNCDIKKSEIDSTKMIDRLEIDPELLTKIDNIVSNKETLKGIKVKLPSKGDPLGYLYIQNWQGIEELSEQLGEKNISTRLIFKLLKSNMLDRLNNDINAGVYVLANNSNDGRLYLTLRSYGYDQAAGELHKEGHVFGPDLASKIVNVLDPQVGSGGGHKNACGFKSHKNINFETQVLPFIEEVVAKHVNKTPDLTVIPESKLEQLKTLAFVNSFK